jgi:hypothetical protein
MGFAVMAFLGEHISQACLTKWRARKKKVLTKSFLTSVNYESVHKRLLMTNLGPMTHDLGICHKCDVCYKCDTYNMCHTVTQCDTMQGQLE